MLERTHGNDDLHEKGKFELGADLISFCEGFEPGV